MDGMVANLCDLVAQMPIEIVAHSTFMPAALMKIERDVHAWWTEEREDRFIDAVVASGTAYQPTFGVLDRSAVTRGRMRTVFDTCRNIGLSTCGSPIARPS